MKATQENYSYDELKHYLEISRTALRNFEERYPDLSFEYIHPRVLANRILDNFSERVNQQLFEETAYLEPMEQDSISIGSVCKHDKQKALERSGSHLQRSLESFEKDLEHVYQTNLARIFAALMGLQKITATFTAERIDKHEWHKKWVRTQEKHYANYHVRESSKFEPAKDLDWHYVDSTENIPDVSGVYFLYHEGLPIYIGHSANLNDRLGNHDIVRRYYDKNEGNGYNIDCVYTELPVSEAKSIERQLIWLAKPKQNRRGKTL